MQKTNPIILLLFLFSHQLWAQRVENVMFKLTDDATKVEISYFLTDPNTNVLYSVLIYCDDRNTGKKIGPLQSLTGTNAFGEKVTPSIEKKTVVWNVKRDLPGKGLPSKVKFRVEATPQHTAKPDKKIKENYTETVAGISFKMIYVEGGEFMMGRKKGMHDEKPLHEVTLSSYHISESEVTHAQFITFLNDIDCTERGFFQGKRLIHIGADRCAVKHNGQSFFFKPTDRMQDITCPVTWVSWYGAKAYCEWLSQKTKHNYFLPTEAQWEYAARGGAKTSSLPIAQQQKYSGSNKLEEVAWYGNNSNKQIHPVKQKKPNQLGIYDMSGNVWEWCEDLYHKRYYEQSKGATDPVNRYKGLFRVNRGCSWGAAPNLCYVRNRDWNKAKVMTSFIGFRVVR